MTDDKARQRMTELGESLEADLGSSIAIRGRGCTT